MKLMWSIPWKGIFRTSKEDNSSSEFRKIILYYD